MVSVIIPVYNAKQFVCEALASAVAQTYVQEVLLIDDCSTDGSMEAVQTWLDAHSAQTEGVSVRLLKNPKNIGVAETRNWGVNEAEGCYVAFLDADDRFVTGKLEKQVKLLEQTGACLCNTARVLMRPDGSLTQTVVHTPEKITLADLEKTNVINCSSVVARREVMLQFPMEHSEVHEDYLTWLRMLRTYPFAVGIDEPLLEYRLSENGKSRNKWKSAHMTYRTYRLAGYSVWKSCRMFGSYMVNGLKKYVKC